MAALLLIPSEVEKQFMSYVASMSPRYRATCAANISALARDGQSDDTLFLTCYIGYTVQGPSRG